MQVKTYRGANNQAVFDRIKADLGPEAIILGSKTVDDNGTRVYEVTAALDRTPEQASPAARVRRETQHKAGGNGNGSKKTQHRLAAPDSSVLENMGTASPAVGTPGWGQWHQEWTQIREHLLAFMRPQMDYAQLSPRQRLAMEYLEREGLDQEVLCSLFRVLQKDQEASILTPLTEQVRVQSWGHEQWPQRFHGVTGPSGVGKTTALIRMGIMLKQEDPRQSILLVNADVSRGGGRLLLRHYAELTEMDYREVAGMKDILQLVKESQKFDKILIDLPGAGRERLLEEILAELGLDSVEEMTVHLAMSPFFAPAQYTELCRRYYAPQVASLIWTKLDEAWGYGAVVNVGTMTGLPVSAFSSGPGLKDTLTPAVQADLWRLVFKHTLPSGNA